MDGIELNNDASLADDNVLHFYCSSFRQFSGFVELLELSFEVSFVTKNDRVEILCKQDTYSKLKWNESDELTKTKLGNRLKNSSE